MFWPNVTDKYIHMLWTWFTKNLGFVVQFSAMFCCHFLIMHSYSEDKTLLLNVLLDKFFDTHFALLKGQLISELNFSVFKSPKKPTKFYQDFCPMKLGQKSVKNLVGFLGDLKTPNFHSEIN